MAKIKIDMEELEEMMAEGTDGRGFCRSCGQESCNYCEPDARNYPCSHCGENEVFGFEELMLMGEIL